MEGAALSIGLEVMQPATTEACISKSCCREAVCQGAINIYIIPYIHGRVEAPFLFCIMS